MKTLPLTTITFPQIQLQTRDAHKLRGYFGNLFREHSPLLHNHYDEGQLAYRYPLVQYKVLKHAPTLVGLGKGAQLLIDLFLKIKEIKLDHRDYPILSKHIRAQQSEIGISDDLHSYRFETLWMALNQKNFTLYTKANKEEKALILKKIATANILAFYKGCEHYLKPEERIMMKVEVEEKSTQFKNQKMLAFSGKFISNALLPDRVGIGKSTSRGFGTIIKEQ